MLNKERNKQLYVNVNGKIFTKSQYQVYRKRQKKKAKSFAKDMKSKYVKPKRLPY